MARRSKSGVGGADGSSYSSNGQLELFSSGCAVLDCVLGGGYPLSRMVNIWGDKSTGKTLLALEAVANFARTFPNGHIFYNETESAFDRYYAENLGIPMDRVILIDTSETIEDLFEHIYHVVSEIPDDVPALYIVDSIDALSTKQELERGQDGGVGFNTSKAQLIGQLFRRYSRIFRNKRICSIYISQSRMKINPTFMERKVTKSGGKAIDFFMTQIIYLAQVKVLHKTVQGIKRPYGVLVKAKCDKNKIGPPFRDCEFEIIFSFGIDDIKSSVEFLSKCKKIDMKGQSQHGYLSRFDKLSDVKYAKAREILRARVIKVWKDIETGFAPTRRKY